MRKLMILHHLLLVTGVDDPMLLTWMVKENSPCALRCAPFDRKDSGFYFYFLTF